jgi:hypothetical protein
MVLVVKCAVAACVPSACNEYIGLLRERLAKQIGCSLANVRMFCMGEPVMRGLRLGGLCKADCARVERFR